ncbi:MULTISPECIES: hypothetical protein [Protofrankia]|uniref:Uncharacterized protein n=1 Tax=Candidatus Protofrankia datiscae TaxID=2716812 RepID=F8B484_9ACTN|nr:MULTISPECIES: hypothetical protein [Protofrankia]AEH10998.1 hypothetical protein FsymDg_3721 [Candidatus Protofrankia datiscae]
MTSIRDDLRSLPVLLAFVVVVVAIPVLALRIVGLAVCVVVDGAERIEAAVTGAVGIPPLAASLIVLTPPADLGQEAQR